MKSAGLTPAKKFMNTVKNGGGMEKKQTGMSLNLFEERVRLVSAKGPLLSYSFAVYVSGLSRTRLRQLVADGKLGTEKVNGQCLIVLQDLVGYRRQSLKCRGRKTNVKN